MTSLLSGTLNGLRACKAAGESVGPELLDAAIECLVRCSNAEVLRQQRDQLIRAASQQLPEASAWAKAGRLALAAKRLPRIRISTTTSGQDDSGCSVLGLLKQAADAADLPESQRQYYRVLEHDPH